MLPEINNFINNDLMMTSKTYNINKDSKHISGNVDGKNAIIQSVQLMLNIQRYESLIYNWSYGVEFEILIGKDKNYIISELKRMLKETLLQDDRINDVNNFIFKDNNSSLEIDFTIVTNLGDIDFNWEVNNLWN